MITLDKLDDLYWPGALSLYRQAFPEGKPEHIVVAMFRKQMAYLHVICDDRGVIAMAITGQVARGKLLLIDYLAVRHDRRGQGVGQALLGEIKSRAVDELSADGLLIEVEYGKTTEDVSRLRFWQRNGFVLTEYVHRYIWVPELYQAMYCPLVPDADIPADGRKLFKYINDYHGKAFRGEG